MFHVTDVIRRDEAVDRCLRVCVCRLGGSAGVASVFGLLGGGARSGRGLVRLEARLEAADARHVLGELLHRVLCEKKQDRVQKLIKNR